MPSPHSSAGVYTKEIDLSQVVVGVSSSIGVIVGESNLGPVMQTTLVTSTKQFLETFGKPDASVSFMHYGALAFLEHGSRLYVTRVAPGALYGGAVVSLDKSLSMGTSWIQGETEPEIYPFSSSEMFTIYGANPGAWNNEISVLIYPNTRVNDGTFYVDVYRKGTGSALERFLVHLNYRIDGYGVQINLEEFINKRSAYIRVKQNFLHPDFVASPERSFINALVAVDLAFGANASRKATTGELLQAWDLYRDPEAISINLLINGGYALPAIQLRMAEIAQQRMDCMAILDVPPMEQRVPDALHYRRNTLMLDSSYAALYSPDYLILDQYSDLRIYIPPSGHVAGAYARTDSEFELWFAPAGMTRGRLSILGVRHVYNQGDRDALYDSQINSTRVIIGSGIKIWGADTLQVMASALSNVSVRRLMIYLEKSLSEAAIHSVFDPNDPILRAQLVELCERFLEPIKRGRGLYAYGVVCDDSNNPPETVANGDLHLDVYCDPVLPTKRILLTAVVNKTGARFVNN